MKKIFFAVFFFPLLAHAQILIESRGVEALSRYPENEFPQYFKTWPLQRGDAQKVYRVRKEGNNHYLAADDSQDISEQIFREFGWNIKAFPYFKWRWRARILPKGAAENNPTVNDSACGVYIIFGRTSGTALKFTWSSTLPVGTVYEKKPGQMVIQVLESGPRNLNQWRWQSVHIPTVYEQLLKHPMKRTPTGFAVLTDGNATHTPAACDYDDFIVSSKP